MNRVLRSGAVAALLAACGLSGCDFIDITLGQGQSQDHDTNDHGTPSPTPGGGGPSCAESIRCERVEWRPGDASAFRVVHSCDRAVAVTCERSGDGTVATYGAIVSGTEVDPGPAGGGGGTWVCKSQAGTCEVRLES